jgi:hypothetical protein
LVARLAGRHTKPPSSAKVKPATSPAAKPLLQCEIGHITHLHPRCCDRNGSLVLFRHVFFMAGHLRPRHGTAFARLCRTIARFANSVRSID